MMNLKDARENYYTFTGKLSDVNRQLCFAGIAVVWIVVVKDGEGNQLLRLGFPSALWCFVLGLAFDLLHYFFASASWGIFHRLKERNGATENTEIEAPAWINWMPGLFFWLKVILTVVGYWFLLKNILGFST